jgi:hypothetical protein
MKMSFVIGSSAYAISTICIAVALVFADTQYASSFLFIAIIAVIVGGCAFTMHLIEKLDRSLAIFESKMDSLESKIFDEFDRQEEKINGFYVDNSRNLDAVRKEFSDDIRELSHSFKKNKDKVGF